MIIYCYILTDVIHTTVQDRVVQGTTHGKVDDGLIYCSCGRSDVKHWGNNALMFSSKSFIKIWIKMFVTIPFIDTTLSSRFATWPRKPVWKTIFNFYCIKWLLKRIFRLNWSLYRISILYETLSFRFVMKSHLIISEILNL